MANEATINIALSFASGTVASLSAPATDDQDGVTVTGDQYQQAVQKVTTTWANVNYGPIAAADVGFCKFKNLNRTGKDIQFRVSGDTAVFGRLKPKETAQYRIESSSQIQVASVGGEEYMQFLLIED